MGERWPSTTSLTLGHLLGGGGGGCTATASGLQPQPSTLHCQQQKKKKLQPGFNKALCSLGVLKKQSFGIFPELDSGQPTRHMNMEKGLQACLPDPLLPLPYKVSQLTTLLYYLMGMSFMISLNMEGDTTGSQSLGKRGSVPLSTTFRSNIQRLKDSLGASIPEGENRIWSWKGASEQRHAGQTVACILP